MPKFVPNSNLIAAIVPVIASAFVFNQATSTNQELTDKISNFPIIRETKSVLGIRTSNSENLVRQSETTTYEDLNYNFYNVLADTDIAIRDNTNTDSIGGTVTYTKPEFTEEDKANFLTYVIENFHRIGSSYDVSFNKIKLEGRDGMPLTGDLDEDEGFIWADKDVDKLYLTGQGGTKTEILTKGIFNRNLTFKRNITVDRDLTVKQNVSVIGNFSGATATLSSAYLTGNLNYQGNLSGGTATLSNTRINGTLTTTGNFSGATATLSSAYLTGNLNYQGNLSGGTATLSNTRINGTLTTTGNFSGATATLSSAYLTGNLNYQGNLSGGTATLSNTRINGTLTTTGNFSGATATLSSAYLTGGITLLGNLSGTTATLSSVYLTGNLNGATATLSSAYLTGGITLLGNLSGTTATLSSVYLTGNLNGATATLSSAYLTGGITLLGNLSGTTATLSSVYLTGNLNGATATLSSMYIESINLPNTTSEDVGVIFKNGVRFIHNFQHPTGDSAVPVGDNLFFGIESGNFLMGATATGSNQASNNIGLGKRTLFSNTKGFENIAIGNFAMQSNTTGGENIAIGHTSLENNISGGDNVAIGPHTLQFNSNGFFNIAIGSNSLNSNTTGDNNTGVGSNSLNRNTDGNQNTGIGRSSLFQNTTGGGNTGLGADSLYSNTDGYDNTAVGLSALYSNVSASYNSAFGLSSMYSNVSGENNSAFGSNSLQNNFYGSNNVAIGFRAGNDFPNGYITNPNNSIFIGSNTQALVDNGTNEIVIGHNAIGLGSHSAVLGNEDVLKTILRGNIGIGITEPTAKLDVDGNTVRFKINTKATIVLNGVTRNIATEASSDLRLKAGIETIGDALSRIGDLRGIYYNWRTSLNSEDTMPSREFGLVAQEVAEIYPELTDKTIEGVYTLDYAKFTALLIEGVKEQQIQFEGLSSAIGNLNVTQMQNIYDQFVEVAENLSMSTENGSLVINSKLVVTGEALFNNATFTGNVNVGQVKIDSLENDISIDTASCVDMDGNLNEEACETNKLSIMNNKAGNVDFFDGKANINPKGEILGEKVEAKSFKSASSSAPESTDTCSPKEFKFGEEDGKAYIFYCTSESNWVRTELNNY